jgi:hypothetical protein
VWQCMQGLRMRLGTFEVLLRAMVGTCEINDGGRYSGDTGGFEMKGEFNLVGRLVNSDSV